MDSGLRYFEGLKVLITKSIDSLSNVIFIPAALDNQRNDGNLSSKIKISPKELVFGDEIGSGAKVMFIKENGDLSRTVWKKYGK